MKSTLGRSAPQFWPETIMVNLPPRLKVNITGCCVVPLSVEVTSVIMGVPR
jgi:hypothetical protein